MSNVISTGDSRLDKMLNGGFVGTKEVPMQIIIEGDAGTGKTSFVLQIACGFVKQHSSTCLFYSLDQKPAELRRYMDSFQWIVPAWETSDLQAGNVPEKGLGGIIFLSVPYPTKDGVVNAFKEQLKLAAHSIQGGPERVLVVVDSLDALLRTRYSRDERDIVEEVMRTPASYGYDGLFTLEKYRRGRTDVAEYLATALVELGMDIQTGKRHLFVRKLRGQDYLSLKHSMDIRGKTYCSEDFGIRIYPNILAVDAEMDERLGLSKSELKRYTFGVKGMDAELVGETGKGIHQSTLTIIWGNEGTRKVYWAAQFLRSGLEQGQRGVFFSFKDWPAEGVVSKYLGDLFKRCVYFQVNLSRSDSDQLVDFIREHISEGNVCERVVFYGVDSLMQQYQESVGYDIIRVLVKTAKAFGCTIVLVADKPGERLLSLADNLIQCRQIISEQSSEMYLGFAIGRFDKNPRLPVFRAYSVDVDRSEIIVDADLFEDLIELPSGELGLGSLTVHLYVETEALREVGKRVQSVVSRELDKQDGETTQIKQYGSDEEEATVNESLIEGLLYHSLYTRSMTTQVVLFDEFWAGDLIRARRLLPLDDLELELDSFLRNSMRSVKSMAGKVYGASYYVNIPVLCFFTDFLEADTRKRIEDELGVCPDELLHIDGPIMTWEDVQTIANIICETHKDIAPFSLYRNSREDITVLVLQWLFPKVLHEDKRWPCGRKSYRFGQFSDEAVVDTVERFLDPKVGLLRKCLYKEGEKTVFRSCWYTNYLDLSKELGEGKIALLRVPSYRKGAESVSLIGDWFLGILAGSQNPRRAARVIKYMTSIGNNQRILDLNAALPARKVFKERRGLRSLYKIHEGSMSRQQIVEYRQISPIVSSGFRRIFTAAQATDGSVKDVIKEALEDIDGDIEICYSALGYPHLEER